MCEICDMKKNLLLMVEETKTVARQAEACRAASMVSSLAGNHRESEEHEDAYISHVRTLHHVIIEIQRLNDEIARQTIMTMFSKPSDG